METGGRKLNKAVIVTKSTNFEPRAEIVGEYLKERDIEVTYIYADFFKGFYRVFGYCFAFAYKAGTVGVYTLNVFRV